MKATYIVHTTSAQPPVMLGPDVDRGLAESSVFLLHIPRPAAKRVGWLRRALRRIASLFRRRSKS